MRRKLWFSTILILLLTGFTAAQNTGFTPDPGTQATVNADGEIGDLSKATILDKLANQLSALSVTIQGDADNLVKPGEQVKIRTVATMKFDFQVEKSIKKALIYYCPSGDTDCQQQKERPRELKVDVLRERTSFRATVEEGETYSFPLSYTAPEKEGLYVVYSGVTTQDESMWASDVSRNTFRVQSQDTSTGGTGSSTGTGSVIDQTVDQAEKNPLIAAALLIGLALIAVGVGFSG